MTDQHNIAAPIAHLAVPIGEVKPYPRNPRRGNLTAIIDSLAINQQYRPIVVNQRTNEILAGNHTWQAAHKLKWTHIAVTFVDVDDQQAARIVAVDNRANDIATYDFDQLKELLDTLPDLSGTGYTAEELDNLLAGNRTVVPPAALTDPDDVPDIPDDPISKPGDLWMLGPHRLLCGDATNPDHIARVTADTGQPGIVYTDPPYGISIVSGGKVGGDAPFGSKSDDLRSTDGASKIVAANKYLPVAGDGSPEVAGDAFRLIHLTYPQAHHVWWGGNHYAASASLPDGSCWLVWDKENTGNFADAELAWTNHDGAVRLLRHMWNGMLRASERGKRVHPTQKPVALAQWAFEVVDPKAERAVVLDVFGGSGSTLIAAHATNRVAAVIEMEPAYVDVICKRFHEHTGIEPVLAEETT